jgi:hypothetical protein
LAAVAVHAAFTLLGNCTLNESLRPLPRFGWRSALFALLILPVVLSSGGLTGKVVSAVVAAVVTGTYRESRIRGQRFESRMVICFLPLRFRRWKLQQIVEIATDVEGRMGCGWVLVFGPFLWLMWRLCDWLLPWIGGEYAIWLVLANGKRILAWQGNSDDNFQWNLELLERLARAPVVRA